MKSLKPRTNIFPTNYQRFSKTELRLNEAGKFVPTADEPKSLEELDNYGKLKQAADSANEFKDFVERRADTYQMLDGTKDDLNSSPGVVAVQDLAHVYLGGGKRPVRNTLLEFEPATSKLSTLKQKIDGDYADFHLLETLDADLRGDLAVEYQQSKTEDGKTNTVSFSLEQQPNGNFLYEVSSAPLNDHPLTESSSTSSEPGKPAAKLYKSLGGTTLPWLTHSEISPHCGHIWGLC